jgi:hypothetical protein
MLYFPFRYFKNRDALKTDYGRAGLQAICLFHAESSRRSTAEDGPGVICAVDDSKIEWRESNDYVEI